MVIACHFTSLVVLSNYMLLENTCHRKDYKMKLILFLDDQNGMLFNHRRLARDQTMYDHILEQNSGTIWMNNFTAEVFPNAPHIKVSDNFFDIMGPEDTCIIEDTPVTEELLSKFQQLTIYKWNRHYPSDVTFDCSLAQWHMASTFEFKGSSHNKITEESYEKN